MTTFAIILVLTFFLVTFLLLAALMLTAEPASAASREREEPVPGYTFNIASGAQIRLDGLDPRSVLVLPADQTFMATYGGFNVEDATPVPVEMENREIFDALASIEIMDASTRRKTVQQAVAKGLMSEEKASEYLQYLSEEEARQAAEAGASAGPSCGDGGSPAEGIKPFDPASVPAEEVAPAVQLAAPEERHEDASADDAAPGAIDLEAERKRLQRRIISRAASGKPAAGGDDSGEGTGDDGISTGPARSGFRVEGHPAAVDGDGFPSMDEDSGRPERGALSAAADELSDEAFDDIDSDQGIDIDD